VYTARGYWLAGGELHYILASGDESAVDLNQVDMQRTVDENAKHGMPFTLKPSPNGSDPTPGTNGTSPDRTGSSSPDSDPSNGTDPPQTTTPTPASRINLTSQPQMQS